MFSPDKVKLEKERKREEKKFTGWQHFLENHWLLLVPPQSWVWQMWRLASGSSIWITKWQWCQQTRLGVAMKCAAPFFFLLFLHHQLWARALDRRQMRSFRFPLNEAGAGRCQWVVETSALFQPWNRPKNGLTTRSSFRSYRCMYLHDYLDFH